MVVLTSLQFSGVDDDPDILELLLIINYSTPIEIPHYATTLHNF
jgi:hypothetical protein